MVRGMTIIVANSMMVATDTGVWTGATCSGEWRKVRMLSDGGIIGMGGSPGWCERFFVWLDERSGRLPGTWAVAEADLLPKVPEGGFCAVWLTPGGDRYVFDDDPWPYLAKGPWSVHGGEAAIGVAVGALCAGATPARAVRAAIDHTDCAKGSVEFLSLRTVA